MESVSLRSAGLPLHSVTLSKAVISETPFMIWYVVLAFCSLLSVEGLANKTALNTPTEHQNALNFRTWVMACVEDFKKGSNRSGSPYAPPFPPPSHCKWLNEWPASSTKLNFRAGHSLYCSPQLDYELRQFDSRRHIPILQGPSTCSEFRPEHKRRCDHL